MPQPDNKRARGSATQLQGQTVNPEGVGGIVGAEGAAIGAAISKLQESAPSQIQIGQQARIKDDGSKLFTILQGAAVGAQQGIQNYQKMYQYTSEKEYAQFESEMAEQQRLTGGDARKMAEWARGHTYRPNDVTAKKYNTAMAQIEGKEEMVYENEKLNNSLGILSKMNDSDALDEVNRMLATADPDSRYFAELNKQRIRLNGSVAGTGRQIQNMMYKSTVQSTSFELGENLTKAGISAYDLSTPQANDVARMYALMGGGENGDRIVISPDGGIQYLDNQGVVHQGHFAGNINEEMAEAVARDLGEFAGPLDNPDLIDTNRFDELATVMSHGGFSRNHTSTRKAAAPKVGPADPAMLVRTAAAGGDLTAMAAVIDGSVGTTAAYATETDDGRTKSRKALLDYLGSAADAIIYGDMPINQRNQAFDSMLVALNGDVDFYSQYGFTSEEDWNGTIGSLRKKLVEGRQDNMMTGIASNVDEWSAAVPKIQSLSQYRGATNTLVRNVATAASGLDGTMDIALVGADGQAMRKFTSMSELNRALSESPGMLDSGWAIRLNFDGRENMHGLASALGDSPLVYVGSDGQRPPAGLGAAIAAHRQKIKELKNVELVRGYQNARFEQMQNPNEPVAFDPNAPTPDQVNRAAKTLLDTFDPLRPESAQELSMLLASPFTPADSVVAISAMLEGPDHEQVLQTMRPTEVSIEALRNGTLAQSEQAKVNNLAALYSRTETRDIAMRIATGSADPENVSRFGWELTQGTKLAGLYDAMGLPAEGRDQWMNAAYGAATSQSMQAMVEADYMAPVAGILNPGLDDATLKENLEKFTRDPIMTALGVQWAKTPGNAPLQASLLDPETSADARAWIERNLALAKTEEVWARSLGGGGLDDIMMTNQDSMAPVGAQEAMVTIISGMSASNGVRPPMDIETAYAGTVDLNGVGGTVQVSVGRQLWLNAAGRGENSAQVTDSAATATLGMLEVLDIDIADYGMDPAEAEQVIETWATTGYFPGGKFIIDVEDALNEKVSAKWSLSRNNDLPVGDKQMHFRGQIAYEPNDQHSSAAQLFVGEGGNVVRMPATEEQRVQTANQKQRRNVARNASTRVLGSGMVTIADNLKTSPGELEGRATVAANVRKRQENED
jgi:hypothetical protein